MIALTRRLVRGEGRTSRAESTNTRRHTGAPLGHWHWRSDGNDDDGYGGGGGDDQDEDVVVVYDDDDDDDGYNDDSYNDDV